MKASAGGWAQECGKPPIDFHCIPCHVSQEIFDEEIFFQDEIIPC
jgi:hypothetical protein